MPPHHRSFLFLSFPLFFLLLSLPLLIHAQSVSDLRDVLTPYLTDEPSCVRYCLLTCFHETGEPRCSAARTTDYRQGCTTNGCLCGSNARMKLAFERLHSCAIWECSNWEMDGETMKFYLVKYCRIAGYQLDDLLPTSTTTRPRPTIPTRTDDDPLTDIDGIHQTDSTSTPKSSESGNSSRTLTIAEIICIVIGILTLLSGAWGA